MLVALALLAPATAHAATTAFLGNVRHDGYDADLPAPPLGLLWAKDLGGPVGGPLVAGGRVFVIARPADGGAVLEALSLADGSVLWTRPVGGTYSTGQIAYDANRLFIVNFDGVLTAVSPADGAALWTKQMPGQYAFSGPPAAAGGQVFLGGAGSGGTLYAVDADTGDVQWTAPVMNGDDSSPAIDADRVYVTYACNQTYAFNRATGALVWHHQGPCEGGGGATSSLHGGRLFTIEDGGLTFDAPTGAQVGALAAQGNSAFADGVAYSPDNGGISASDAISGAPKWLAMTGSRLHTPVVGPGAVYAGSGQDFDSGFVVALDRASGTQLWCAATGGVPVTQPLAAGPGVLLVPAGNVLAAYGKGGVAPAPCTPTQTAPSPGDVSAPGAGPGLALTASKDVIGYGRKVRLTGTATGLPAGTKVVLDADPFPFDGYKAARTLATDAGGGVTIDRRPARNVRYRLRATAPGGTLLQSAEAPVTVSFVVRFKRTKVGARRIRERVTFTGSPKATLPRRMAVYRIGAKRMTRVARPRLRKLRPGTWRGAAVVRGGMKAKLLSCYRERRQGPWNAWTPLDAKCGRRHLPLVTAADARLRAR